MCGGEREETLLAWRVHPAASRPGALAATLLFIAAVSLLVQLALRTPWMTLVALGGLLFAAGEFLFPTHCALTPSGAVRRGLGGGRRVAWSDVRRVWVDTRGVRLSPLDEPSGLVHWRGLFLPLGEQREAALALVDRLASGRVRPSEPKEDERDVATA